MNLTIEQMREIVDGAPKWAVSVNLHNGMYYGLREVSRGDLWLMELRTAIADHDRIDTCTDIKNHISPNTKVIEHE